ncbi:hypothetical protein FKP32DRAFT_818103 [Trametes sanguinea]|nr:hypothetical protein FKP32DRAFT_818103 [Trametes sanguinea]
MIRARLADPRHASSSKYDSLETTRLLALRDSRLQDLLRGSWRDDEGHRALRLITSLAGLVYPADSSASSPGDRVDDETGALTDTKSTESQTSATVDVTSSLPIAAARHPSHLHGLSAPLFPKAVPSQTADEDGAQASRLPYAVEERLAGIEDVHRSLQEALAAAQAIHAKLHQRLQKAKSRPPASAPSRTPKIRPLQLDGSLWSQRTGNGLSFKAPEDAASLLSHHGLEAPISESSVEERIAQIRSTILPPFTTPKMKSTQKRLEDRMCQTAIRGPRCGRKDTGARAACSSPLQRKRHPVNRMTSMCMSVLMSRAFLVFD